MRERWKVTMNRPTKQQWVFDRQHTVRCLIRHQHVSICIGSNDRSRTAFDKDLKLLLRLQSSSALAFDLVELFHDDLPIPVHFVNKHADGEERHKVENIAWGTCAQIPGELIELLCQVGAESG